MPPMSTSLIEVLQRLVEAGNSVLIIEHNLDIIKGRRLPDRSGPEGGDGGGEIVAQAPRRKSVPAILPTTGQYLRPVCL